MPEELKKIELDTTPPPKTTPQKKRFERRVFLVPAIIVVVFVVVLGLMLLPLKDVIEQAKVVIAAAKEVGNAVKNQDLEKTKTTLIKTRNELKLLDSDFARVRPLTAVPFLGVYFSDVDHGIKAGFAALDAGENAIAALEPQADLLGLKGKSTFVSGSADERLQTAVKTMSALIPKVNAIAKNIETLEKEIGAINPDRYPEKIGSTAIRSQLVLGKELLHESARLFVNAQPLIVNLPKLLGEPNDKRYLVLFQNDKEIRPTGGFITAYAQFRLARGKPILEKADDIYALDNAIRKKFPAPREILTFHKGVYQLNIRDSNLSPDFKESMVQFETMYNTAAGREAIDGIWAVDTHVLVEALKILGPINIYGREFSAETDTRCDCPKAVYELEDYSSRPVGYVRQARKDIIGILLQQIMQKALGVSPSQYWGKLFQMFLSEISQKHIMAFFDDAEVQKAAESFNLAGRIMTKDETAAVLDYKEGEGWDYLHVNNSNMAGAKSNMFVSEKIVKDMTIGKDGMVTTKLTIDYDNPYPQSDCNLEHGKLCLNAPLRNWFRVYVPKGSKLVDSKGTVSPKDGKAEPMNATDSLSKTVFEGFTVVNPLGKARVELTYATPVTFTQNIYRLLWQKQPGTDGQEITIKINGKERKKGTLDTDTEFTFPL